MTETSKANLKQDWAPTEPVFRKFLHWLDQGSDSNGGRYLEMRTRLVRYFDRKNCLSADELADETLNRVARRLEEEGAISEATPAQYCYIVAKFVFLEHLREARGQITASESEFDSLPAAQHPTVDQPDSVEKRSECLDHCLASLPANDRELILEYYRGELRAKIQHRRELSEKLGLSINALSIRACRIRDKLEKCVSACAEKA